MIQYVLDAYKHSDDHLFNEHFKKKEGKWLKSEITLTLKDLLQDGQSEYLARKRNKESAWGALSQEQQEIIDLSAKVDVLKKEMKQKKRTSPTPLADAGDTNSDTTPNGRKKDAWKFNSTINGKQHKAGDKITKDGKDFWWCPHHYDGGMWCRHKPAVCTKNPNREETNDTSSTPASDTITANEANTDDTPAENVEGLIGQFEVDSKEEE